MRLNAPMKVGLILAFVAVLALGGVVGLAFARDKATYDIIPANTYIEGVDVSGMTAQEATSALASHASAETSDVTLTLTDELGNAYPVSLSNEVSYDVSAAVDKAVQRNHDVSALSRIVDSATRTEPERADISLDVAVDTSSLHDQIAALADSIYAEPADAYRDFNDDDTVTVHADVTGRTLDVDASTAAAAQAVRDATTGSSLADLATMQLTSQLVVTTTPASVTVADLPPCIIVDYDNTTLYVFGDDPNTPEAEADALLFTCAIGYGQGTSEDGTYTSPTGLHYIEYKDAAPTWTNPDPTGWGKNYAETIPAGPDNPLGLRALKVSDAPMIYLHGVSDPGLTHNNWSHGCINIYNDDVVTLFDLIPDPSTVSTPVYVYFHGTQATYPGGAVVAYQQWLAANGY